jgi:hypothetical protein
MILDLVYFERASRKRSLPCLSEGGRCLKKNWMRLVRAFLAGRSLPEPPRTSDRPPEDYEGPR